MLPLPSKEYLDHLFLYGPITGEFLWKQRGGLYPTSDDAAFNTRFALTRPGRIGSRGVRQVHFGGVGYIASRIVYKMVTGEDPKGVIVAKNGKPDDLRFDNLLDLDYKERSLRPVKTMRNRIETLERKLRDAGIEP